MKGVIHHIILQSLQRRSMQVIDAVKVYSVLKLQHQGTGCPAKASETLETRKHIINSFPPWVLEKFCKWM